MKAKKILIVLIIVMSFSLVLQINKVQAALQSNGDAPANKDRNTWMTEVRQMEILGGTLGLKETQNADLTSSSGSNNLDIHMQKNTEYGAMALLSASAYGKPTKIEDGETTTGNETGVVIPYNEEWTAAQYTDHIGVTSYADRYINYYNLGELNKKRGDALLETRGRHSTVYFYAHGQRHPTYWDFYYKPGGIVRKSGIFGFNNSLYAKASYNQQTLGDSTANPANKWATRAVIINGEGI